MNWKGEGLGLLGAEIDYLSKIFSNQKYWKDMEQYIWDWILRILDPGEQT